MEVKQALILDGGDFLSQAMDDMAENGTAVIITKNGAYIGIIDDRNLRSGISDPSKVRCESVCVKAPHITRSSSLEQKLNAFLSGHFKALPVLKSDGATPEGEYTRAEMLREIISLKMVPSATSHSFMNSPVFAVDSSAKVSEAKSMMKEKNLGRLAVTHSGVPVGLISTHDFTAYLLKPKQKKGSKVISEITNANDMPVSNFMREVVPSVSEDSMLEDAIRKMADGNFSSILVVSGNSAVGVISATDVFRHVISVFSNPADVLISGLGPEDMRNKEDITSSVLRVVSKFEKSFSLSGINIHFKKGKSVYSAQLHMKADNMPLSLNSEAHSIKEAVDIVSNELHNVLAKKKNKAKNMPVKHAAEEGV